MHCIVKMIIQKHMAPTEISTIHFKKLILYTTALQRIFYFQKGEVTLYFEDLCLDYTAKIFQPFP